MKNKKTNDALKQVLNSSIEIAQIFKTKDYDLFGHINGNRLLDDANLKKIQNSIKEGYIETNAIICAFDEADSKQPLKIIDGQHRFEACKREKKPISFVIDQSIDIKNNNALNVIIRMNTASKEWDVNGFMLSEATRGNKNYKLYQELFTKYEIFEHELFFFILNNNTKRKQVLGFPLFKEGKLKFDDSDYVYMTSRLDKLMQFVDFEIEDPITHKSQQLVSVGGKRYYIKALNMLFNTRGFDDSHLLDKLHSLSNMVSKCNTVDQALEQIKTIYNHSMRSNKLYIAKSGRIIDKLFVE